MLTRRCVHACVMVAAILVAIGAIGVSFAQAQELGGAGTIQGTVKDPTGGVMQAVDVKISNWIDHLSAARGRFPGANNELQV